MSQQQQQAQEKEEQEVGHNEDEDDSETAPRQEEGALLRAGDDEGMTMMEPSDDSTTNRGSGPGHNNNREGQGGKSQAANYQGVQAVVQKNARDAQEGQEAQQQEGSPNDAGVIESIKKKRLRRTPGKNKKRRAERRNSLLRSTIAEISVEPPTLGDRQSSQGTTASNISSRSHNHKLHHPPRIDRLRKLFLKNQIRDEMYDSALELDCCMSRAFSMDDLSIEAGDDFGEDAKRDLSLMFEETKEEFDEEEEDKTEVDEAEEEEEDAELMAQLRKEVEEELGTGEIGAKLWKVRRILNDLEKNNVKPRNRNNEDYCERGVGATTPIVGGANAGGLLLLKRSPIEVRVDSFTYSVKVDPSSGKIMTVYNSSFLYQIVKLLKWIWRYMITTITCTLCGCNENSGGVGGEERANPTIFYSNSITATSSSSSSSKRRKQQHNILQDINMVFEPGKSYLILGAPGSGKTSLLKAISGLLQTSKNSKIDGSISYNGRTLEDKKEFHIENAFAYIDQLDKHAARLTVGETFEFAHDCKLFDKEDEVQERAAMDILFACLGLEDVKNTFVGDTNIRGVSGGQRRRVTVGEQLPARASVLCGDEVSTGLDASSTFDIVQVLLWIAKLHMCTRVFSLLQPSPETVSLFDDIILLGEGRIIYAGPVSEVEDYFAEIGFICPRYVDTGDFLTMVSSGRANDSASEPLYDPSKSFRLTKQNSYYHPDSSIQNISLRNSTNPPSLSELAGIFHESRFGSAIKARLQSPHMLVWEKEDRLSQHGAGEVSEISCAKHMKRKYANNFSRSTWLILKRFLILWIRDKRVIIAGAIKNIIMGLSVGGCYLSTTNVVSIEGALFQAGLFIILGSMQSASALIDDRIIYYKHADANFYSSWPFVFGRVISQLPQITSDTVIFATIMYYMIGLADRVDVVNFFIYLSLLWVFAILMNQQLAIFASFSSAGMLNAYSACVVLVLVLFCGFIITPYTIPNYYLWLYVPNPFSWVYRALVINEFRSGRWSNPDEILTNSGFTNRRTGEAYGEEWIRYAFAFTIPYSLLCTVLTALCIRGGSGSSSAAGNVDSTADHGLPANASIAVDGEPEQAQAEKTTIEIPFKPVTLSFHDICYDVTASTSSEKLRLLNNVNGIFRSGRMCALMGTSGAGKTTLMDVIALRKRSGTISGSVLLNGWPQDKLSFTRSSGYVEQFDVQSPELTVHETVLFSARLRLDPMQFASDEETQAFVDQIMDQVELSSLRDSPVGAENEGTAGLSFEQKKRLSIAVELAASPSIIFLDEPTSGLDARSALLVVKTLRKIADGGRTICATIHQPSSAVFGMFDDLLLLKKGGHVVFHGKLGKEDNCSNLMNYFESRGAEPIELGDNPANWMLRVMDSMDNNAEEGKGLAELYLQSDEHKRLKEELQETKCTKHEDSHVSYDNVFAASRWTRQLAINRRLRKIYWRSPTYNYSRLLVSIVIAFVLGSAFISERVPDVFTENDMRSRVSGIMAILSVLPVMTLIRDMFYRHRDAGMYDSASIGLALGVAEKPFIIISTFLFTTVFLATGGFIDIDEAPYHRITRGIAFWGFFTFNFAIYSYFGQLFVCLVKPMATAIILCSVFIGLNNFFSGLVVRPQFLVGTFYAFPYYITPGQYCYNGLLTSIYHGNNSTVVASNGTEFQNYLNETGNCDAATGLCSGTAEEYVNVFFGGEFSHDKRPHMINALVLGAFLLVARVATWIALKYIRFS